MSIPDDADENIGENLQQADEQLDSDAVDRDSKHPSEKPGESRSET